jgi:hypothetical protein
VPGPLPGCPTMTHTPEPNPLFDSASDRLNEDWLLAHLQVLLPQHVRVGELEVPEESTTAGRGCP